jgi:hypothetical protein
VVNVAEKVYFSTSGVIKKVNANEPLMKCRNSRDGAKTERSLLTRDQSGGNLFTVQMASGIEAARA